MKNRNWITLFDSLALGERVRLLRKEAVSAQCSYASRPEEGIMIKIRKDGDKHAFAWKATREKQSYYQIMRRLAVVEHQLEASLEIVRGVLRCCEKDGKVNK